MAATAHMGITLLEMAQSQKEMTVNEAFARIDAILNSGIVDKDLNAPPASPAEGDIYIVGPSPTGAWAGQAGKIAYFDQYWRFIMPNEGILMWVNDENAHYVFSGAGWSQIVISADMTRSVYDPAGVIQQVVGTGAVQTVSHKTINLPGHIHGLTLANSLSDSVNDIDIAPGVATDSSGSHAIALGAALTKRLDAGWEAGSGNGGLDSGSVKNATYHVHLIRRALDGVADALFSLSAASPVLPPGYGHARRIGSVIRAEGGLLAFKQMRDRFLLLNSVYDVNVNFGAGAALYPLTVPEGLQVDALIRAGMFHSTVGTVVIVTSPDEADQTPVAGTYGDLQCNAAGLITFGDYTRRTNTARQIRVRTSAANTVLRIHTYGWIDTRGA